MHYDVQTRISVTVILNLTLPPSPAPHQLSQKRGAARACFRAMRPTCSKAGEALYLSYNIFLHYYFISAHRANREEGLQTSAPYVRTARERSCPRLSSVSSPPASGRPSPLSLITERESSISSLFTGLQLHVDARAQGEGRRGMT